MRRIKLVLTICVFYSAGCSITVDVEKTKAKTSIEVPAIKFESTVSSGKFEGTSSGYLVKTELSVVSNETIDSGYTVKGGIQ